jgi:cell division protein FtsW
MKNKRAKIVGYDYHLLAIYFILMLFGLYMQINIGSVRTSLHFFFMQLAWSVISIFSLWFAFRFINFEKARKLIFPFLIIIIILLIIVLVTGVENKGGIRRIFGTQPSLFARVLIILYFAHILDKKKDCIEDTKPKGFFRHFNSLIIISIIIFGLVFAGRHLSILIILAMTLFWMLWIANIRFATMMTFLSIIPIMLIAVLLFGREYRKERVDIYANYSLFHRAAAIETQYTGDKDYQIQQSLISLASGGLWGTTPARGTGKHYFLPEARTDYIFSIIGEEFGFIVAAFIWGLYVFLFIRTFIIAKKAQNMYQKLAAYGLGMNIFFNALVNVGVAMSALPSTGVTLPFISYGGTSLLVNSFSIGLLLNISAVRKKV